FVRARCSCSPDDAQRAFCARLPQPHKMSGTDAGIACRTFRRAPMICRNKKTGLFMTVRFPAAVSLAILLGGLLSSSVIAQTEPIVSTLEEIGFFGTWAIRCDAPASLENVVR